MGLLKPTSESISEKPIIISEQEREKAEEEKVSLPDELRESLLEIIHRSLSQGSFQALDQTLAAWEEDYKDSEGQEDDEAILIASYRADIAAYEILSDPGSPALDAWLFYNPDALAAAIAFAPISSKYLTFLDLMSSALSPATAPVHLVKSEKSNEDLSRILERINSLRTSSAQFPMLAVYDMTLFGSAYEFIAVADPQHMKWRPYSLKPKDLLVKDPTMQVVQEAAQFFPEHELDSLFVSAP